MYATCIHILDGVSAADVPNKLLKPIKALLPGTSITIPGMMKTIFGDLEIFPKILLHIITAMVPINILNSIPVNSKNTVV